MKYFSDNDQVTFISVDEDQLDIYIYICFNMLYNLAPVVYMANNYFIINVVNPLPIFAEWTLLPQVFGQIHLLYMGVWLVFIIITFGRIL